MDFVALEKDAVACSNPKGACCSMEFCMLQHAHVRKTAEPLNQIETLKNHHLIMTIDFKVIPTGELPNTSLVLRKNNKFEPKEQNFRD